MGKRGKGRGGAGAGGAEGQGGGQGRGQGRGQGGGRPAAGAPPGFQQEEFPGLGGPTRAPAAGPARPQQQPQPAVGPARPQQQQPDAGPARPQQQQPDAGPARPHQQPVGAGPLPTDGATGGASGGGDTVLEQVTRQMESMKMLGVVPPEKRVTRHFPGKEGIPFQLVTNHFPVSLAKNQIIYKYNVIIKPPWDRPYRKRDTEMYFDVFAKWKTICPEVRKNPNAWVFNGNNIIYSTLDIARIQDIEDICIPGENKELKFAVREVRRVQAAINVSEEIDRFSRMGRRALGQRNEVGLPQDALNALDVIMTQAIRTSRLFDTVGRSFFRTNGEILDVGFGKEVWVGTFTSMRPFGWKPLGFLMTLNADVANKPAIKNLHLTKRTNGADGLPRDSYAEAVLNKRGRQVDLNRGLWDNEINELEYDMKGLKVRYELPNGTKRCYKFNKFVKPAREQRIPDLNVTVEKYFLDTHKVKLRLAHLPCLHLGAFDKSIYIPMELCSMEKQPMPRGKKLNDESTATMIRSTAVKPLDRQEKILRGLRENNAIYANNPFAREFGISVADKMAQIQGRVLQSPTIEYKPKQEVKIRADAPGSWRPNRGFTYVNGKEMKNWAILDLVNIGPKRFKEVVDTFHGVGKENGLTVEKNSDNTWHQPTNEQRMEKDFEIIVEEYKKENLALDLIMVIFPFKAGKLYDTIKYLGDIKHEIPTQCVLERVLFKGGGINLQVVSNICLKINSKLGGVNHQLASTSRPPCLKVPIMIMGADVSHAAPDQKDEKPSIAAVVGSMDPKAALYECEIRVQRSGQNEEIIQDMKVITKNLLLKFFRNNGRKPSKIIMFRDGVSEGQFLTVLAAELNMMRQACMELEQGYKPEITYLVVQKRHHTRFFPVRGDRQNCYERNGNVLAGTVVDQGINHPTEGDFYLVSHEGIQGTSRPTHYQILWDDSNMTADELEKLTFYLCHLYSRCTRSVSYPTPTYYAHLAADRARKHHNDLMERRCPDIDEAMQKNIKIMYFV